MDFDFDLLLPPSVFHTISVERLVRAERSHASSQGLLIDPVQRQSKGTCDSIAFRAGY